MHNKDCNCDACRIQREEDFAELEARTIENPAQQEPLPPGEYTCTTEEVFESICGGERSITQILTVDNPQKTPLQVIHRAEDLHFSFIEDEDDK